MRPMRIQAITEELDRVTQEYDYARGAYEDARIKFEAARERFSGVKRLAAEVMSTADWNTWLVDHADVKYAAMQIADAVTECLRTNAFEKAWAVATDENGLYQPEL